MAIANDDAPEPPDEQRDLLVEKVSTKDIAECVNPGLTQIHVMSLRWDKNMKWGQIRPLNPLRTKRYYEDIKAKPPTSFIKIMVRQLGGGM